MYAGVNCSRCACGAAIRLPHAVTASIAANGNHGIENIGARRLHTVLEKLLEEISFTASERSGETIVIEAKDVAERVGVLAKNADLSKFIL